MVGILVKSSSGSQPRVKLQSYDWKTRHQLRTFGDLSDITVRIEQNTLGSIHSHFGEWGKKKKQFSFVVFITYFSDRSRKTNKQKRQAS